MKRYKFVDIAKGIGILSVICVHLTSHGSTLSQFLLSYCVSIFFVISGFLYHPADRFVDQLKKCIKRILIPLYVYGMIDAIIFSIGKILKFGYITIIEVVKALGRVFFISGHASLNGPLWFLQVLFWVELIDWIFIKQHKKYSYNKKSIYLLIVISLLIGFFIRVRLPFRLEQVPVAMVFFNSGYLHKNIPVKISQMDNANCIKSFAICEILFVGGEVLNCFSEFSALNYGKCYLLFIINGFSATLSILFISKLIEKKGFLLSFFGKNSLSLMVTHFYFTKYIIPTFLAKKGILYILSNYLVEILLTLFLAILLTPLVIFISKVPLLNGNYIKNQS